MRHVNIIVGFLAGLYLFTACKQDSGGGAPLRGPGNGAATINCNVPNPPASCTDANNSAATTSTTGTTQTTSTTGTTPANCTGGTTTPTCQAISGCMWTGSLCVPTTLPTLPTATTTSTTGTTGTPAGTPTVPQLTRCNVNTQQKCSALPGCTWNGSSCSLTAMDQAPQPTSCNYAVLTTADECNQGETCHWTGSVCNRPSVGLNTTFAFGDGLSNVGTPANPTINCNFSLLFQTDGNLVIFQGSNILWTSKIPGLGGNKFTFQSDGNTVIYNATKVPTKVLWSTSTAAKGALYLLLSQAGNLAVLNSSNMILWDSKSTVAGCY